MEHFRQPASERKKQRNKATAQPERLWGNFLLRTEARRPKFVRELVDKSPAVKSKLKSIGIPKMAMVQCG